MTGEPESSDRSFFSRWERVIQQLPGRAETSGMSIPTDPVDATETEALAIDSGLSATPLSVTIVLFARYAAILADAAPFLGSEKVGSANLAWMCSEAQAARPDEFPLDKLSRWLGFVQGVLAARGLIDVDVERDLSRPLFHAAYSAQGVAVPRTAECPVLSPETLPLRGRSPGN